MSSRRKAAWKAPELPYQTPWQELYRDNVGQLSAGGCLEFAVKYQKIRGEVPRHSH